MASSPPSAGGCVVADADAGSGILCNPVTNQPCQPGEQCDYNGTDGFACYPPPNDAMVCGACSQANGPYCTGGDTCVQIDGSGTSVCARYCCTDADCGAGKCTTTGPNGPRFGSVAPNVGICTTGAPFCGDGIIEAGEQCDGMNLGTASCDSLGYGGGTLVCDPFCHLDVSGCLPLPNCLDPMADCTSKYCIGMPGCVDSCAPPVSAGTGSYSYEGSTVGRPHAQTASCSSSTPGHEQIFQIAAAVTGKMFITVTTSGLDLSVSVRTACGDAASEIGCATTVSSPGAFQLVLPVTAGQTYFVMVQGVTPQDDGSFYLYINNPAPETACTDFQDNDFNGLTDCDDPNCQATSPACVPGTTPSGAPCSQNTDCAANHKDPICILASDDPRFVKNYCSEFCDPVAQDCAAGSICATAILKLPDTNGVCLQTCAQAADCRVSDGYACVDLGLSSKVCMIAPEILCNDYQDNDFDGLIDCADPTNCQTLPACTPGSTPLGQPCAMHNQCTASAGINNPFCIPAPSYPNGYCSHFCDAKVAGDCGANGVCLVSSVPGQPGNLCLQKCTTNADCRAAEGYTCQNVGGTQTVCAF